MAPRKKSFLDSLKDAVLEDDGSAPAAVESPEPAAKPNFAHIPNLGAPAPAVSGNAYVAGSGGLSEPVDEQALKLIRDNVYPAVLSGRPSRYIQFRNMFGAVGNNVAVALSALKAVDPQFNAAGVVEDIALHEKLLADLSQRATTDFEGAARDTVGKSDEEALTLQEHNAAAEREIARHQREIAERAARLQTIAAERAEHESKLARARKRTSDAEAVVRAELLQTKQTLSALQ